MEGETEANLTLTFHRDLRIKGGPKLLASNSQSQGHMRIMRRTSKHRMSRTHSRKMKLDFWGLICIRVWLHSLRGEYIIKA